MKDEPKTTYYAGQIETAVEMKADISFQYGLKKIAVRKAYGNGSKNPKRWTYCVTAYDGNIMIWCENGVRLDEAANHVAYFARTKQIN